MRMPRISALLLAGTALTALSLAPRQAAAEALLSGTIATASGEKLGGVTVSAKAEGQTISTIVFTDAQGAYYFPSLPPGRYAVMAQAVSFATGRGTVDLQGNRQADLVLTPATDFVQQLTGDQILAALPSATPGDREMKQVFRSACVGCHTPEFTLQHRFDAAGWTAVLELMKRVNVFGAYQGADGKLDSIIEHNQARLASYLARVRGPGPSEMSFKPRPRPSGEAARVVFREYDVPSDPELGLADAHMANDGSDWMAGSPSALEGGKYVHDAWPDLDGNIWFTNNTPSHDISIGRVDAATGAVKFIKVPGPGGFAANSHGMTRDPQGFIWFNIGTVAGHAGLGRLDPKSEKISVFVPPDDMPGVGGAPTVDFDGTGKIWVSAPDGVLRFDPVTERFSHFKSPTAKTPQGSGLTYGVAADRDGNGWWAQMAIDIVGHTLRGGEQVAEIRVPPVASIKDALPAAERAFYEQAGGLDFSTPLPYGQGPRRMGADKASHYVYVCNYWGGNLMRIDTETLKTDFIPLPDPENQHPYHAVIDSHHKVWVNMMNADQLLRYDPDTGQWSAFDLPGHGAETRYVSILERDGRLEFVLPYYRTMKVTAMTFRSEAEMRALEQASASTRRAAASAPILAAGLTGR